MEEKDPKRLMLIDRIRYYLSEAYFYLLKVNDNKAVNGHRTFSSVSFYI